ncbi:chemotaxis protein CheB [Thiorhodococcus minor]|uniref:histidine kinase n=1 Tax=Thiorhodococcus minor TaxID=57489 RepID=A0A6M0K5F2_9GAMM|nr:chemotaxis protein CheB [Thiorhodococcus minor]NEV64950.1 PAS domain S-box protein [Thiorhodococcus minor]
MIQHELQPRLVVGVGASAGGLDAFRQLLAALPDDSGMAFLLVQHLDPTHKSLLTEILAPSSTMRVQEAAQDAPIAPNHVYVIQPNTALGVSDGRLQITEPELRRGLRLPVDHLFRSLAREYGPRAVGIVLSGAGSDGSSGILDIESAGGLVLVQDPSTCRQRGMPQSAIDTDISDLVLEIRDMPRALERFASIALEADPECAPTAKPAKGQTKLDEAALTELEMTLRSEVDFDLRIYKPATIQRRVLRRMAILGCDAWADYLKRLRQTPAEQRALVRDFFITVTELFRDPEAFQVLRETVIDPLVARAEEDQPIRVWVPGCATGEEAYSIAIELLESAAAQGRRPAFQIFATDVDKAALESARAGVYPPSIAARIPQERLRAHFDPLDARGYQVRAPLREILSLAAHDLAKDSPFLRMDLVSCRNLLIYLRADTQKQTLRALHFALRPDGCLFLGPAESTAPLRDLFSTLSKRWRIYRKSGSAAPPALVRAPRLRALPAREASPPAMAKSAASDASRTRQAILKSRVPPAVVVLEDGTISYVHGEVGPYLRFPQGETSGLELKRLIRPELATRTRAAIYKCRRDCATVVARSSPEAGLSTHVRITVSPASDLDGGAVILSFEDVSEPPAPPVREGMSREQRLFVADLEDELRATREDLINTVEELETSNEELRSSNEQTLTMNEELQSANEELEATTEELITLNAQLREKVEQLQEAHDDLSNFFASTKIATLFLDESLCVKRFTPAATELLDIDDGALGRHVDSIARELLQHDLVEEAQAVLRKAATPARDLAARDGRWITRQVLPYRTESARIEGVVVTFTDVTELRSAYQRLATKNRRLDLAWEAARGGIYEYRLPLDDATFLSPQWSQLLGYQPDELPPYHGFLDWLEQQIHPDDRARYQAEQRDLHAGRVEVHKTETCIRHRDGRWIWVREIAKPLERDADGRVRRLLGMMLDITDLKESARAIEEGEERLRMAKDAAGLGIFDHDLTAGTIDWDARTREIWGIGEDEPVTYDLLFEGLHPDDRDCVRAAFERARDPAGDGVYHVEYRVLSRRDGRMRWVSATGRTTFAGRQPLRFVGTVLDVTAVRETEDALRASEERFRTLADNMAQLAWMADGQGWIFWYNKRWMEYTGTTLEEMQGWAWRKVHHPDYLEPVVEKISRCFRTGEIWEDTFPLRGADGRYRWFLSRAIPIHDEKGAVVRWFGTNTDITERRDAEQQLREADRRKDEFLAMLGHELRNPLASIQNAAEMVNLHHDGKPHLAKAHDILQRQITHTTRLIDGLLDVSRINRGKISLRKASVELRGLLHGVVQDHLGLCDGAGLELSAALPDQPLYVDGDSVRLVQVFSNLIDNAVKFTEPPGRIEVELRRERQEAVVAVRDTGLGIRHEMIASIFEPFRQDVRHPDRPSSGLGLGLSLAKGIVELHQGSIEVHSAGLGAGSELVVRLPRIAAPSQLEPKALPAAVSASRILIVEDNADLADSLLALLKALGHDAKVAENGTLALERLRDWRPDIGLCDIGLPDMSGYDLARAVREDADLADIRLCALTGYGMAEDRRQALEAGFDQHMTKPINLKALQEMLTRLAGGAAGPEA